MFTGSRVMRYFCGEVLEVLFLNRRHNVAGDVATPVHILLMVLLPGDLVLATVRPWQLYQGYFATRVEASL